MDENPYQAPQEQIVEKDDGGETSTIRGTVTLFAILALYGYCFWEILSLAARFLTEFVNFVRSHR
jgi:hypothetical protein